MKTGKILICKLVTIVVLLTASAAVAGQQYEKVFRHTFKAENNAKVIILNYDTDLEIMTWDKPQVELHMIIDATINDPDDAEILDSYLESIEYESTPDQINLETRFWESINNIMGITRMKLKNNKTIRIKKFDMECKLWIPENASLGLKSRYSDINMEDIGGNLVLELYDDELLAGNVKGKANIEAKYSEMNFTGMSDIEADLYNCELSTGDAGDINIYTKYSKIHSGNAGTLNIDSYEDDFSFDNCNDIKFIAKYSEFTTGKAGKLVADNYECEFMAESVSDAKIDSKYSEFIITSAKSIDISSSYEDLFETKMLGSLMVKETKYGEYDFGRLEDNLTIESGYEDEISVDMLGPNLELLKINGRYLDIDFALASDFECRFEASINYYNFDIDEDMFRIKKHIKDGNELLYIGFKGTEKDGMPQLRITGYEVNLSISEY